MDWLLQKAIESGLNNDTAEILNSHAEAINNNADAIRLLAQVYIFNLALWLALAIYVILSNRKTNYRLKKLEI